jgi:DNA-binding XRE family transcriptional regulator
MIAYRLLLVMISPSQIRGARAMLGLTQSDLAAKAGISKTALIAIETAASDPKASTLSAIQSALESAGVEFTNGDQPGVRLKVNARNGTGTGLVGPDPFRGGAFQAVATSQLRRPARKNKPPE